MTIEERLSAIEKELDTVHYREQKVALLISESTYHAIIDQVIELESGSKLETLKGGGDGKH
ncbi:hypothetical protein QE521_07320 [Streptococcus suis]|uniref:hypothetical protein n=2 Tax=Streptococcus suis TaxID=1307 RepID=UPI00375684EC